MTATNPASIRNEAQNALEINRVAVLIPPVIQTENSAMFCHCGVSNIKTELITLGHVLDILDPKYSTGV